MRIFCTCYLGGRAGWIWDKGARIWCSCERIGRRDAVMLCRRDYHAKVAVIAAYQDGWDKTRVECEFIFDMVECLVCRFPADFGYDRVIKVRVFVVDGGG